MFRAFDVFALGGTRDWSTELQALYKNLGQQYEQKQKEQDLQTHTQYKTIARVNRICR
jgi:hypothetical protein